LKTNTTLKELDLGYNGIGDAGGKAFAEMLKTNTTLKALDLSDNGIGDAGGKALAEMLKTNTTLTALYLMEKIGVQLMRDIRELIKQNKNNPEGAQRRVAEASGAAAPPEADTVKQERIEELEAVNAVQQQQIADLQQQIADLQQQTTGSQQQITDLQQQITGSQHQNSDLQQQIADLQQQTTGSQQQIADLQQQKAEAHQLVSELRKQLEMAHEENARSRQQYPDPPPYESLSVSKPLIDRVLLIEQIVGENTNQQLNGLQPRLAQLEALIHGAPQSGNILHRLSELEAMF
jgi:predicted  nucleic acid-binding Zn-ribbon protein